MTITPPANNNQASIPQQQLANYQNQQLGQVLSGNPGQTTVSPGTQAPGVGSTSGLNQGYSDAQTNAQDALNNAAQQHLANQQQVDALTQQRAAQQAQLAQDHPDETWTPPPGGGDYPSSNGVENVSTPAAGGGYSRAQWGGNSSLSQSRNQVLSDAFSYVGDPYVLGGLSHQGIDCSGLVEAIYSQFGLGPYVNSHSSRAQGQQIPGVRTSVSNLQPGDIVAWADGSHIAIYAGNGMIVAAAAPGEGVKYQPVWGNVYGIHLTLPGE